jgi:hypothetical protein
MGIDDIKVGDGIYVPNVKRFYEVIEVSTDYVKMRGSNVETTKSKSSFELLRIIPNKHGFNVYYVTMT